MDLFCIKCRRPADFHDDDREIVVCPPPCGSDLFTNRPLPDRYPRTGQGTTIHVVPPKRYQQQPPPTVGLWRRLGRPVEGWPFLLTQDDVEFIRAIARGEG
jgi:hypothetical protein